MTIATAWNMHALLHVFLLHFAGRVLAIGHGDDPAHEDVGGRGHGGDEGDDEERVHERSI